jgi:CBS domain containing-hemolysin-like protein
MVREIMTPITGVVKLSDLKPDIERCSQGIEAWGADGRYAAVDNDKGRLVGIIPIEEDGTPVVGAPLIDNFTVIKEDAFLQNMMVRMAHRDASAAIVLKVDEKGVPRAHKIAGVVVREDIADAIIDELADIGTRRD